VTHTDRRFALGYLLLVIVPIAGLAGLLRSESKLTAPAAIGGLWKMRLMQDMLAALPCGGSLPIAQDVGFTIAQSGRSFTLSFANANMSSSSGTIDRTNIEASLLASGETGKEPGCTGGVTLSLTATLDSKTNPKLMEGVLSVNDCPACIRAEFRAVRDEETKK
jgi:hypothetical protein